MYVNEQMHIHCPQAADPVPQGASTLVLGEDPRPCPQPCTTTGGAKGKAWGTEVGVAND